MYQIANLYELMGDMSQAVEWYFQVVYKKILTNFTTLLQTLLYKV